MPLRKEPKETVVYPASKRKAPPFKPQRPSKAPRLPVQESQNTRVKKANPTASTRPPPTVTDDEDADILSINSADNTNSDEELEENPLAAKSKPAKRNKPVPARRKPSAPASEMSLTPEPTPGVSAARLSVTPDPGSNPTTGQLDGHPTIPQPLLVRLLHEHFLHKDTQIDKHAMQVLQKYFELFIRETISRAQEQKKDDAEKNGRASEVDVDWLELEDLEKVAAQMMLDF